MAYQIDFYCNLIHWFINYDIRVGVGVWEGPKLNDEYEQPLRPVSFKIETIRQSLNATNGKPLFQYQNHSLKYGVWGLRQIRLTSPEPWH